MSAIVSSVTAKRQLALLAAGLARRGHDVAVAMLYNGGTLEMTLNSGDVRLLPIGKLGRWHVAAPLARLRRIFVSERPDLVYAFLPIQTTLAALLLPRKLGTKLVFGLRATDMQLDHYGALEALSYRSETWLGARADLIIANALAVRAAAVARGIPEERIIVVPNGFDTEAMRPDSAAGRAQRDAWGIPSDRFVIGCIARLDPMKDHATFINAAAQFAQRNPDAHFVCVGEGEASYREKLKHLAQSSCLNGRLFWAGEVADMKAAYSPGR
jgi:glycosyltransferase involved in cell wall biosynthesis